MSRSLVNPLVAVEGQSVVAQLVLVDGVWKLVLVNKDGQVVNSASVDVNQMVSVGNGVV